MPEVVILLAGGASTRTLEALGPKGLISVRGTPFICDQVQRLQAMGYAPLLVTGEHHEAYASALQGIAARLVRNPSPQEGPFSSLRVGLAALDARARAAGVFVLPLDVPAPSPAVFEAIRTPGPPEILACVPTLGDRGGHPVHLRPAFVRRLLGVTDGPDARLDRQLARLAKEGGLRRQPVDDPGIFHNLNTAAAWRAYLQP